MLRSASGVTFSGRRPHLLVSGRCTPGATVAEVSLSCRFMVIAPRSSRFSRRAAAARFARPRTRLPVALSHPIAGKQPAGHPARLPPAHWPAKSSAPYQRHPAHPQKLDPPSSAWRSIPSASSLPPAPVTSTPSRTACHQLSSARDS
jgi:hypothetical protein